MPDTNFGRSNVFEIFPKKIGSYTFKHEHKTHLKQLCFDIIDKFQNNREYVTKSHGGYLTHYFDPSIGSNSLLDYPGFEIFHSWIKQCSIDYINNTLGYECHNVIITQCWMNDCSTGGFQNPHSHTNSIISGTYFVNFVPGLHSPLAFLDSSVTTKPHLELEPNNNKVYYSEISIKQSEGQLLLWESHVGHSYNTNYADKRLSISFNVMPETISRAGYGFKLTRL